MFPFQKGVFCISSYFSVQILKPQFLLFLSSSFLLSSLAFANCSKALICRLRWLVVF
nr:MAG TPA: hypothetical protein [Bacteriophage sp.]